MNVTHISASKNIALVGGAVFFDTVNYVEISKSNFEMNVAVPSKLSEPPAVSSMLPWATKTKGCFLQELKFWRSGTYGNVPCIPLTSVQSSRIGQAGGLFFTLSGYISFFENNFLDNVAAKDGGVLVSLLYQYFYNLV